MFAVVVCSGRNQVKRVLSNSLPPTGLSPSGILRMVEPTGKIGKLSPRECVRGPAEELTFYDNCRNSRALIG